MLTITFWKGAAERAIKTFIQSFVATLLASIGAVVSAWEVPWESALTASLGVAVLATVLSLATSIGNADFTAGANVPTADGRHEATPARSGPELTGRDLIPGAAHTVNIDSIDLSKLHYPVATEHDPTEADPARYTER